MTELQELEGNAVQKPVSSAGKATRFVTLLDVNMIPFPFPTWIGITEKKPYSKIVCSLYIYNISLLNKIINLFRFLICIYKIDKVTEVKIS